MDGDVAEGTLFEWDWVKVFEVIEPSGQRSLGIEHSPDSDPWKLQGMLQAAADYYRQMTTDIFFSTECECDDDD